MVTPIKVNQLVNLLRQASYPESEVLFLEKSFTEGFDIGYEGPRNRRSRSDNIPLRIGSLEELWNKIMSEV